MYHILYVDDEPSLLEIGKLFLEKDEQFSVDTLTTAPAALSRMQSTNYDAIISDYQMPDMDGIEFLKRVRGSGNTIPFILFTGRGREEIVIQALNEGANFYLQKGGDPTPQFVELSHQVRQAIQQRRAEVSIRDHERREQEIINFLPDATVAIDTQGIVIAWNQAIEEMTGIPASRILGKGDYEYALPFYGERRPILIDLIFSPPDDIGKRYANIVREGTMLAAETALPHLRGEQRTLWGKASLLYNQSGKVVGAIEVIRDVTKEREREYALRESEEKYRTLVESSFDGIVIHQNGSIVYANTTTVRLFGAGSANELIGKSLLSFVHPDYRDIVLQRAASALEEELPVIHEKFLRTDGSVIDVDVAARPFVWRNKPAVHVVFRDITERKRAEEALVRKNDDLSAAYEELTATEEELRQNYDELSRKEQALYSAALYPMQNPLPVLRADDQGVLIYANPASGHILESWNTHLHAPLPSHIRSHVVESLARGSSHQIEEVCEQDTFSIMFTPICDQRYVNLYFSNITGCKQAEETLVRKNDDLSAAYEELTATEEELRQNYDELSRKELELSASEERYRNVVEDQTEFISRFLPDGTHVFVNEAYCRYFNKKREEIIGKRFVPHIPAEDRRAVREHFASLTKDHPVAEIRHRIIMPDGQIRWQRWNDRAIFDADGNIIEYQSVGRDISDIIKAEEALRESEEKYRQFFRTSRDSTFITSKDGNWIDFNDAAVELFGYSNGEELKKVKISDLYANPEDRKKHIKIIADYGYTKEYPVDLRRKGGTVIPTLITSVARYNAEGNAGGFQGTIRDISAQKRAEEALRESEEKYRDIFNNTNDAIQIIELKNGNAGRFIDVNEPTCSMLQYTRDEMLQTSLSDVEMNYSRKPIDVIEQEMGVSGSSMFETALIRKDGVHIPVEVSVHPVLLQGRHVVISVARNITERKRAEEALRRANRELNLMASITRHDILNKVTTTLGYLGILRMKFPDPALANYIGKLEDATKAIRSQIEFTSVYQDLGSHEPQWQEPDNLVRHLHVPDTITLTADLEGIEVFADPMLEKVFFNLLDNSVRHGQHVTDIRVSSRQSDEGLMIAWEDNGVGVKTDEKDKIFERGFGKNTGLGLFLVREVLSLTGITIKETGVEGKGARFEIMFPKGKCRFTKTQ